MGCITTTTKRRGGGFRATAERIGGRLRTRTSLVCTVDTVAGYVRVSPQYVWLASTEDLSALVRVESNRAWKAE